jgi:hypothetical protein
VRTSEPKGRLQFTALHGITLGESGEFGGFENSISSKENAHAPIYRAHSLIELK